MTPEHLALADRLIDLALDEDIGPGDATSKALFAEPGRITGLFRARAAGVMSGGWTVGRVFARLGARFFDDAGCVGLEQLKRDGERFVPGDNLIRLQGNAAAALAGERTAINLLQRMIGVATRTAAFVDAVAGTRAKILDTRKTNPGMRVFDKAAVVDGGGINHRFGLYDMVLIKDNHLALYGGARDAVREAKKNCRLPVMVEVDTLEQLADALEAEPDYVLLDNMRPDSLARAVAMADRAAKEKGLARPLLEASGGVTLESVRAVAETGVDRISVGGLTHGAGVVDIGLDFEAAS
jgi:nicotinate-nucleotide pyrophosphorylase (carboxylating)